LTALIFNLVFAVVVGLGNGWIAKQLEFNRITNKRLNAIFKSQWHNYFMLPLRIFFPIVIAYLYGDLTRYSLLGLAIQLVTYDSLVDLARGRLSWKFVGTCEGAWDFGDCFWLKLAGWHINHLVVKLLVLIIVIFLR